MDKKIILALLGASMFAGAVFGANNNDITYTLSDAGGGNTLLTWVVTGGITVSGVGYDTNAPFQGIMVQAPGIFNGADFNNGLQSLTSSDGSYYEDVNTSSTSLVDQFMSVHAGAGTDIFGLACSTLTSSAGQNIKLYFGTGTDVIPMAFSDFNEGTYTTTYPINTLFSGNTIVTLDVEAVPEPTPLALAAWGTVVLYLARRRK